MMPSNPNQMVPGPPGMVPMQNQNVPSPSNMNMVPMGPQGGPPMPGQPMVPVNQAGPPMNQPPPPQGPPGSHQASNNQPGQQHDLSRLRNLICLLKDSLANLMRVASINISYNCQVDTNGMRNTDDNFPRFDKALEDFYAICNQVELCLRTILECSIQTRDSKSYLPFQVSKDIQLDPSQENTIPYPHYLSVIKKQVNFAKRVFDILSEGVRQIKQSDPIPPQQPSQQQQPPAPPQQQQQHPPQMHGVPPGQVPPPMVAQPNLQ